jgi:hypothetical protein
MRPRRGTGEHVPARELRRGDVLIGKGWEVFVVEELADGARVKVTGTAPGGRLRSKTYASDELVEVKRPAS